MISEKVIEEFSKWARNCDEKNRYPLISDRETSYYIDRNTENTYIMEYSPDSMQKIREMLEEYSGLSEPCILKRVTIEICQNRYMCNENIDNTRDFSSSLQKNQVRKNSLPEFRYEF